MLKPQNIWAVGRNYIDHAKELNNPVPEKPLIFLKAGSCSEFSSSTLRLPDWAEEIHYETEIVLQFDSNMKASTFGLALDLTERIQQNAAKKMGLPWTLAKSFVGSCPVTKMHPLVSLEKLKDYKFNMLLNGTLRQMGELDQMLFKPDVLIEYVTRYFPVVPGDLLLTGTPAGVGALAKGDVVQVEIPGVLQHKWTVT